MRSSILSESFLCFHILINTSQDRIIIFLFHIFAMLNTVYYFTWMEMEAYFTFLYTAERRVCKLVLTLAGNIEAVIHAICHININSSWWHVHRQVTRCNLVSIRMWRFINCAQISFGLHNSTLENSPILKIPYKYFTYRSDRILFNILYKARHNSTLYYASCNARQIKNFCLFQRYFKTSDILKNARFRNACF